MTFFVPMPFIASGIDPDAAALIARMTSAPNSARKGLISDTIKMLKAGSVWLTLDGLYLFAAHDNQAARLNWVANAYNCTDFSSPLPFTIDRGFQMGSGGYCLDTNFNPTTASSPHFVQNSGHMSFWSRTDGQDDDGDAGYLGGGSNVIIRARSTSDLAAFGINSGTETASNTDGRGHFLANRSGSNAHQGYINGSLAASGTTSSTAPTNVNFSFGRRQSGYSSRQFMAGSFGGSLTSGQVTALYNALSYYKSAVGA